MEMRSSDTTNDALAAETEGLLNTGCVVGYKAGKKQNQAGRNLMSSKICMRGEMPILYDRYSIRGKYVCYAGDVRYVWAMNRCCRRGERGQASQCRARRYVGWREGRWNGMEQRGKWSIGGVTSTREYFGYGYGVGGAKEYAVSRYSRVSIGDGWTPGALVGRTERRRHKG